MFYVLYCTYLFICKIIIRSKHALQTQKGLPIPQSTLIYLHISNLSMCIVTYLGLEYGEEGEDALWFLLGCECLFAFESRPPPGDILPASALRECSMAGGGRVEPSSLVTLKPWIRVSPCLATAPYLLIRGAGAHPPPASSPPDTLTHALTTFKFNVYFILGHSILGSASCPIQTFFIHISFEFFRYFSVTH